jgi:selenocysteine lyase/cysteine desulfurase
MPELWETLWETWRREFPITKKLLYLNHAAVAPLSRRCADAMQLMAQDALENGSIHYADWMACYQGLRISTARLINALPSEIALVKNTSEGIAIVATGMRWQPGDVIVAFREEFAANFFPWKKLESTGVTVRWLSVFDSLDKIADAARGARMLALSYVQYLSGYRADLVAIGEICSSFGCFFFVDAIQGMGAFPIDVEAAKIDALAADGHKWMLGPEGCGVLYIRQSRQDEIEPVQIGWTNFAHYSDYAARDMTLRGDAGRYESGTLNTIGCYGLRAAIDLLLEVGVENITPAVRRLADQIRAGAEAAGYECLGPRTPETGAGIVAIKHPVHDSLYIVRRLKDEGISVTARQGWVRISPHFYISPADIDRLLVELAAY